MPPLKVLNAKECFAILKKHGFVQIKRRGKGSHIYMLKQLPNRTIQITLPNHGNKALKRKTLREIVNKSEIPRSEYEVRSR